MKMLPTICLRSGKYFDLLKPETSAMDIDDIAWALSNLCRFNGHVKAFYSVAQHSLMSSMLVPEECRLEALMHDAVEAFIGDVTSPLKQLLPEYKTIERCIEQEIRLRYNLPASLSKCVRQADLVMLATERRDLMPEHDNIEWRVLDGVEVMPYRITPLQPLEAYAKFMKRYRELTA